MGPRHLKGGGWARQLDGTQYREGGHPGALRDPIMKNLNGDQLVLIGCGGGSLPPRTPIGLAPLLSGGRDLLVSGR